MLALGIFCMILGLVQSSKQPSTAAALVCIRRVALLEKVTSFGAADLKKITIGYQLLGQYPGLLGRLELSIRPASAIICTYVPGYLLPHALNGLSLMPDPVIAMITNNITARGPHALLRSSPGAGGIGFGICIHHSSNQIRIMPSRSVATVKEAYNRRRRTIALPNKQGGRGLTTTDVSPCRPHSLPRC